VSAPVDLTLFNCWLFLKTHYYPTLSSDEVLIQNTTHLFNEIAVFYYPDSGLYHFAKVTGQGAGYFTTDEANLTEGVREQRKVYFNDRRLVGFTAP
jgi:hypothetical protein